MKLPLYFWFEVAALACSLLFMRQLHKNKMLVLLPLLFLTVLYEFGTLRGWFWYRKSNHFAGNIFTGIEFLFFTYIILTQHPNKQKRKGIISSFIIFWIFYFINLLFIEGPYYYNSYTLLIGSLLIIYWCFSIIKSIVEKEEITNLLLSTLAWVCIGFFLFYLFQFANMTHFNYMAYKKDYSYAMLFLTISNVSNFVLYSCIGIGIICSLKSSRA